jgi:hypothetical protein
MAKKRYTINSGCPQCGCSFAQVLSEEEMTKRYGDVANIELECGECMHKYSEEMEKACPEWDQECKLKE